MMTPFPFSGGRLRSISEAVGDRFAESATVRSLAAVLEQQGKLLDAKAAYEKALNLFNLLANRVAAREIEQALNKLEKDEHSSS